MVTSRAVCAKGSLMGVVRLMAGNAGRGSTGELIIRVAITTGSLLVQTQQGKPGTGVVVKIRRFPALRCVAFCAFAAQVPLVSIVGSVACHTVNRRSGKGIIHVALTANHLIVFPNQGEACLRVMIKVGWFPACRCVAASAVCA